MKVAQTLQGLCGVCRKAGACPLLSSLEGLDLLAGKTVAILKCDDFEPRFGADGAAIPDQGAESASGAAPSGIAEECSLGLCANCEHRSTCRFPKPAGGVWHCEEYL